MTVTAHIDISTPTGRRILRELQTHKRVVKIDYPLPVGEDGLTKKTYSVEETFDNLYEKLEEHYGVDLRKV